MKKLKLTGKLSLNKETVSKLNDEQMNSIKGGIAVVSLKGYTCPTVTVLTQKFTVCCIQPTQIDCLSTECPTI